MRVRNILRGMRNTLAGLWASFACGGPVSFNPVFGKRLDLPQITYPGIWKASVPLPLGCAGHARCMTARTKFVGHHPVDGDGTWARTTLPKQSLGSAGGGKPNRLIMPQKNCKGTAGEQCQQEDSWHRAVCPWTRGNGEGGDTWDIAALKPG